eukprot:COSAG01_NODE_568_length_15370_cov_26.058018_9_plen_445_part_00
MIFLKALIMLGTQHKKTYQEKQLITLSNLIALSFFFIGFLFLMLFLSIQNFLLASLITPFIVIILLCLLCNHCAYFFIARIILIITPYLGATLFTYLLGQDAGTHLAFYSILCAHLVLIKASYRSISIAGLICFIFIIANDFFQTPMYQLSSLHLQALRYFCNGVAILILTLVVNFYIKLTSRAEKSLIDNNKKLQNQLNLNNQQRFMLDKMSQQSAFSSLSKGISHEIRTPIMGIMGQLDLVEQDPSNLSRIQQMLMNSRLCMDKILNISNIMLKYGNPKKSNLKFTQFDTIIKEILLLAEMKCQKHQIITHKKLHQISPSMIDETLVFQIVNNVIFNAIDAMKDTKRKRELTISTDSSVFQNKQGAFIDSYCISIQDTGCGIAKKNLKKIFDPFFSEKYNHVGLGLSIALKSIDELNGSINIQSIEGTGTTVMIHIPSHYKS